jgi:predicted Zn-dependent protease
MVLSSGGARRLSAILAALLLVALPGSVGAATATHGTLARSGVRLDAPPPGLGVALTAVTIRGEALALVLETDLAGVTRVVEHEASEALAQQLDGVAASPGACKDGMYTLIGFSWPEAWAWRFRASSTPLGLRKATVESQLRASVRSITAARNDCGMPDRVNARARYLGRTQARPGIRSDATCGRRDGQNVVGFGALPGFIAGLTCTTYTVPSRGRGRAIESDVLLNRRVAWSLKRATCSRANNEVMLRSVASHEFGHVFGLGHVPEATHGRLTMSESIGPCDDSAFTLGRGDVLGLQRLY